MARRGRPGGRRRSAPSHAYPRAARLSETLREIIADELVRIDDERLEFLTVTGVDVDSEMNRATVFFDTLHLDAPADGNHPTGADDEIVEVLGEHRARLQASINRQMHAKKTPVLDFRPDDVIRSAERIENILRADRDGRA